MPYRFATFCSVILAVVGMVCIVSARAADPALRCEAGKLKQSAKYGACRLKAAAKGLLKGEPADFSRCETKFIEKFTDYESKAGSGVCPSEDDVTSMSARMAADALGIATLLAGGSIPPLAHSPASGQTSDFGPDSDGVTQAGAALTCVDNGDGTITDVNTGLMWEKKDASGGIHDVSDEYTWSVVTATGMDGTIVTTFLDTLNDVAGEGADCFAGYCDWRVPNAKELQSIVDYEVGMPSVDPIFHQSSGDCSHPHQMLCTDVTSASCSCTAWGFYWSSTTVMSGGNTSAWSVDFMKGTVSPYSKGNALHVRAVRGGL